MPSASLGKPGLSPGMRGDDPTDKRQTLNEELGFIAAAIGMKMETGRIPDADHAG